MASASFMAACMVAFAGTESTLHAKMGARLVAPWVSKYLEP
jgi:hypothetical protein